MILTYTSIPTMNVLCCAVLCCAVLQVNRAARYCHAAARGGQVLLPKELMFEVNTTTCLPQTHGCLLSQSWRLLTCSECILLTHMHTWVSFRSWIFP